MSIYSFLRGCFKSGNNTLSNGCYCGIYTNGSPGAEWAGWFNHSYPDDEYETLVFSPTNVAVSVWLRNPPAKTLYGVESTGHQTIHNGGPWGTNSSDHVLNDFNFSPTNVCGEYWYRSPSKSTAHTAWSLTQLFLTFDINWAAAGSQPMIADSAANSFSPTIAFSRYFSRGPMVLNPGDLEFNGYQTKSYTAYDNMTIHGAFFMWSENDAKYLGFSPTTQLRYDYLRSPGPVFPSATSYWTFCSITDQIAQVMFAGPGQWGPQLDYRCFSPTNAQDIALRSPSKSIYYSAGQPFCATRDENAIEWWANNSHSFSSCFCIG